MSVRATLRTWGRRLPRPVRRLARETADRPRVRRILRPVRWGSLHRTTPVSARYGFDRGRPVDRVYIEAFFRSHAADIRGRVLEVHDAIYAGFGAAASIDGVDIVDIDPRNDRATIVADLADRGSLPPAAFDCVIVPQTLQYVADLEAALENLWASLDADGVLLFTVPCIAKVDHNAREVDSWRVMPAGVRHLVARVCGDAKCEIVAYGNVLAACAFLMGIAAEELRDGDLDAHDPDFPLVVGARVHKAARR